MKRVLVVLPTPWDVKQLEAAAGGWRDRYELVFDPVHDCDLAWDFDPLAHAERLTEEWGGRIDGVFSSSDYPGATLAGAIATALDLPGTRPELLLRAGHKYYSRIEQAAAAPEATPRFELIDPGEPDRPLSIDFPVFVKPVKGAFSMFTRRVNDAAELAGFLRQPAIREYTGSFLRIFDRMVERFTDFGYGGGYFIAEELLTGEQATVDGWVHDGEIEIVGITDSVLHPRTSSFVRFDYPSSLPIEVQERMADVVRRTIRRLELSGCLFNLETVWDRKSDRVSIIEVNPRICGQFGDLYLRVDGTSTFEMALDVATGTRPSFVRGGGPFGCASSVPLRVFEPSEVLCSPSDAEVGAVEVRHPEALVWNECRTGDRLADFESLEDGQSHRYGVINVAARDRSDLEERIERVRVELGWRLRPL